MIQKEFLNEVRSYKSTFEEILSRFHHTRDSISIDQKDGPLYHQIVVEAKDLLQDFLGNNQYSLMIVNHYNEGLANFFRSPSYDSVSKIITVLGAVITRYERHQHSPEPTTIKSQETTSPSMQKLVSTIQKHWIVILSTYSIFLIGSTWYVANELLVKPRDFQIENFRKSMSNQVLSKDKAIVLEPTGVREGNSVTSIDGGCLIAVQQIISDSAQIRVTVDNASPRIYPWMRSGDRITVLGKSGNYYIDIQGFRGNMIDIAISLTPTNL